MLRLVPNGHKARLLLAIHRASKRLSFETVQKVTQATPQAWIWLAYGGQNGPRRNSLAAGRTTPKEASRLFGQFLEGEFSEVRRHGVLRRSHPPSGKDTPFGGCAALPRGFKLHP